MKKSRCLTRLLLAGTIMCTAVPANVYAANNSGIVLEGKVNSIFNTETGRNYWFLKIDNNTDSKILFYDLYKNGSLITEKKACKEGNLRLEIKDFDASAAYRVSVYNLKSQKKTNIVSADLFEVAYKMDGDTVVCANGTVAEDDEISYSADTTVAYNSKNYIAAYGDVDAKYTDEGSIYEIPCVNDTDGAVTAKGSITYVDSNGNFLGRQEVASLPSDQIDVSSFTAEDGTVYQLAEGQETSVKLTAQKPDVTLVYTSADKGAASRTVAVNYKDEQGNTIFTDTVNVAGKNFTYYAPTAFSRASQDGNSVIYYETSAENARVSILAGDAKDSYDVAYTAFDNRSAYTWTIRFIDAYTGQAIASEVREQVEVDGSASFTPAQTITNNGTSYTLDSAMQSTYTHAYNDASRVTYIYYNPSGYTAEQGYNITVQYMNIADDSIIQSTTMTALPGQNTNIDCPANVSAGSEQYVRLNGQADGIVHSYYSPKRTYTIYYRNVNDTINADAEVTTIDVITTVTDTETIYQDVPGGTITTITNPTTGTTTNRTETGTTLESGNGAANTANTAGANAGTTDGNVATGTDAGNTTAGTGDTGNDANNDADNAGTAGTNNNQNGSDSDVSTISGEDAPLGNVDLGGEEEGTQTSSKSRIWIPISIVLVLLAGAGSGAYIYIKKKRDSLKGGR